jgi:hypothetical protein
MPRSSATAIVAGFFVRLLDARRIGLAVTGALAVFAVRVRRTAGLVTSCAAVFSVFFAMSFTTYMLGGKAHLPRRCPWTRVRNP